MRFWLKLAAITGAAISAQLLIDAGTVFSSLPGIVDRFDDADEGRFRDVEERFAACGRLSRWVLQSYLGFEPRRATEAPRSVVKIEDDD